MGIKCISADMVIFGGSLGGTLAAYSAAKSGKKTILFEETDWIGGQLTSQAVPPDEHQWIEQTGCTASYRAYRNKVREHYRNHPYIIDELKTKDIFCPGGSTVSRLSHPPKLALQFLMEMLQPYIDNGMLEIYYFCSLVSVEADETMIKSLCVKSKEELYQVSGTYYLDGTDEGDLIAQSGCAYVTGAESFDMTGEPSAAKCFDSEDRQPVTWTLAFANKKKGDFVIEKPQEYEFFKKKHTPYDGYPLFSMYGPDAATGRAKRYGMFDGERDENGKELFGLFTYRRIICANHFKDGYEPYDVTLLNWPQNDYSFGNTFDSADAAENKEMAKQLTLSYFYWLQTEAGYPYLCPSPEAVGTTDGMTKRYYVRESRRIKSLFTVRENELSTNKSASFYDSVGVGSYPIDLHITTKSKSFFYRPTVPFTIPLGAMIPITMKNLIPACKNIGTTHLTNGCYRLHPVEWNVGEVAGLLAAYAMDHHVELREIRENKKELFEFQEYLRAAGIQLYW